MKLLILGGTVFVGRHLVHAALVAGHDVTVFNRGRNGTSLPPEVKYLRGDRDGKLEPLRGRHWDTVIDTSGYVPKTVRASAALLADQVEHYTFISTCSVYRDTSVPGIDENYTIGSITDEQLRQAEGVKPEDSIIARAYGAMYGPLKALCEQAADECMRGRVLSVRAGLIVGPFDYSDRFTYWPRRVAEGGEVLAPGRPARQLQFVDARDLAEWIVRMAEARQVGTYNATGSHDVLTFGHFLDECRTVTLSNARFVWVDERYLLDAGLTPWTEMPLWIPEEDEHNRFFMSVNWDKARSAGLTFRPLAETIRDTVEWDRSRGNSIERRAGLDAAREKKVLQAWHARTTC
jgi:nucleoside-diphosphate-sugar epimerase